MASKQLSETQDPIKLGRLTSLGVKHSWQIPLLIPSSYRDYRQTYNSLNPQQFYIGQQVVVCGQLDGSITTRFKNKRPSSSGRLRDADGHTIGFTLFGDCRTLVSELEAMADRIYFSGQISWFNNRLYLDGAHPVDSADIGTVVPVYPGKAKVITPSKVKQTVDENLLKTLPMAKKKIAETLSLVVTDGSKVRQMIQCPKWTLEDLLLELHRPKSMESALVAQSVIERIEALHVIGILKGASSTGSSQSAKRNLLNAGSILPFTQSFGFEPTKEQSACIQRLAIAMRGYQPQNFLLLGDVGTGKSCVMLAAVAYCASAGGRAVVMLPNQSLALQIHADFHEWYPDISCQLVTGQTDAAMPLIDVPVLIGTTAMLHRNVGVFDLVVCDEEQKLSVGQKQQLVSDTSHQITASATPIPRTTALAQHGGVEVLRLTQCHVAKHIYTRIVEKSQAQAMMSDALQTIEAGGKVLVVCPKREAGTDDSLPSAEQIAAKWEPFAPGRVRCAHAGKSSNENEAALTDMKSGDADVLVSTSVVEVGITIPELVRVIIVHAERFGLTTLHQIRGRVARHGGNGYCDLYCPKPVKEESLQRLKVLEECSSGFEIAKRDLYLRGFGDVGASGKSQHGAADGLCVGKNVDVKLVEEFLEELDGKTQPNIRQSA
ncbi:DEAD/DEAH box helicase [Neiella marina]|uniref:DEAD/DEAH box helicase n=1 Tax=Neiella holothuriorum TaxID=2870530 RepID=A0ABS7EGA2_9GAMM|nr:helicase-related protein [Neiella holothuriorum]MBW8191295.1 DEAD/DEAH box helicase [Neiella holothuriorum]